MANSNKDNTLDVTNALRKVVDAVDESMRVTVSSSTGFEIELSAADGDSIQTQNTSSGASTALNALSAASNQTSSAISLSSYSKYAVQLLWSGLTGTLDGTIKIQGSLDDTTYSDISGLSVTLSSASGNSLALSAVDAAYLFIKVVYTKNNITGGTITAKYNLKG